jgi:hypothetical protein
MQHHAATDFWREYLALPRSRLWKELRYPGETRNEIRATLHRGGALLFWGLVRVLQGRACFGELKDGAGAYCAGNLLEHILDRVTVLERGF